MHASVSMILSALLTALLTAMHYQGRILLLFITLQAVGM
jgi:hypothetical protein